MRQKSKQELSGGSGQQKPIRLLPGMIIILLQWMIWFVLPIVVPGSFSIGVFGGFLGWLAIIVWWAFFSRAPRFERWAAVVLMIIALFAVSPLIHESIMTGMQGMMFVIYATPVLSLAFVIWAVACRNLSGKIRSVTMIATILLACGVWTLIRSEGITGDGGAEFTWRWAETHEDRFLVQTADDPVAPGSPTEISETEAEWSGFRGPLRNSIIPGVRIETDWSASPPVELWRKPVGPGCSSFAVHGHLFYTQEQIGDDEAVSCYNMSDGKLIWRHRDAARFWDSHAGAGPRSTPTLHGGRVYTLGATGILNVLDASDGSVIWSCNASSDTDAELPGWGFTSSPLVVDSIVVVATAGILVAYNITTGDRLWVGPNGGKGYSSPHLMTIDGISQILLLSEFGVTSVMPTDGTVIWQHEWIEERIVQPALTADGDLLISAGGVKGIRRLTVTQGTDDWKIEERWTSLALKPSFNDIVVHKGHVYGFVGPSLACIDVTDGSRKWRGGRYSGQILLLADQDLLLMVSEKGELALVEANPEKFTEIVKIPGIEGKTWNHPVLVGNILLVRNAQEMAAFELSLAGS